MNLFDKKPLIGVFWDIENCCVPHGKCPIKVVSKIREMPFYEGHKEIEFIAVCDVFNYKEELLNDLNMAQICVHHVSSKMKNAADVKIRQLIRRFVDNFSCLSQKMTVVLITSDIDFLPDITYIRHRENAKIILLHSVSAREPLRNSANESIDFYKMLEGVSGKSLELSRSSELEISNISLQASEKNVRARLSEIIRSCQGKIIYLNSFKGTAIIKFDHPDKASRCKTRLANARFNGVPIFVHFNKKFSKKQPTKIISTPIKNETNKEKLHIIKGTLIIRGFNPHYEVKLCQSEIIHLLNSYQLTNLELVNLPGSDVAFSLKTNLVTCQSLVYKFNEFMLCGYPISFRFADSQDEYHSRVLWILSTYGSLTWSQFQRIYLYSFSQNTSLQELECTYISIQENSKNEKIISSVYEEPNISSQTYRQIGFVLPSCLILLSDLRLKLIKAFAINQTILLEDIYNKLNSDNDIVLSNHGVRLEQLLEATNMIRVFQSENKMYATLLDKKLKSKKKTYSSLSTLMNELIKVVLLSPKRRIKIIDILYGYKAVHRKNLIFPSTIYGNNITELVCTFLESENNPLLIIGHLDERELTMRSHYQNYLFSEALNTISSIYGSVWDIKKLSSYYYNVMGEQFDVVSFGVCHVFDMMQFHNERTSIIKIIPPKKDVFVANAVTILSKRKPEFVISLNDFIHFYNECYSEYISPLIIFELIITSVEDLETKFDKEGYLSVSLSPKMIKELLAQNILDLLRVEENDIKLVEFDDKYFQHFGTDFSSKITLEEVIEYSIHLEIISPTKDEFIITKTKGSLTSESLLFIIKIVKILYNFSHPMSISEIQKMYGIQEEAFNKHIETIVQLGYTMKKKNIFALTPFSKSVMDLVVKISNNKPKEISLELLNSTLKNIVKQATPIFFRIENQSVFLSCNLLEEIMIDEKKLPNSRIAATFNIMDENI